MSDSSCVFVCLCLTVLSVCVFVSDRVLSVCVFVSDSAACVCVCI